MPSNDLVSLKPAREHHAVHSLDFIRREFPAAWARIPDGLPLFPGGFALADGVCSHPGQVRETWLFTALEFVVDAVPDGFFLAGLKNSGGSEYLLLMWRDGARVFWLRSQYVNFMRAGDQYTPTCEMLAAALGRWDAGEDRVTAGIGGQPEPWRG